MSPKALTLTTVLGLVITATGIITPIVWDEYKGKSGLQIQELSSITLIEDQSGIKGLQVLYAGRPISGVTKTIFALVNSGEVAIRQSDVVVPPTISFQGDAEILETTTTETDPDGLPASVEISSDKRGVSISSPLLNPGDRITFSILWSGKPRDPGASGRIANVKQIEFIDRTTVPLHKNVGVAVYLAGGFTVFSLLITVAGVASWKEEARIRSRVRSPSFQVPTMKTRDEYRIAALGILTRKTDHDRKPLEAILAHIVDPMAVSSAEHDAIVTIIRDIGNNLSSTTAVMIIFVILDLVGLYFVLSHVFW